MKWSVITFELYRSQFWIIAPCAASFLLSLTVPSQQGNIAFCAERLAPALSLTSFPSDYHVTMCSLVEHRILHWAEPHSFPHQLSIWLQCGNVFTGGTGGSALSSKLCLFPHKLSIWLPCGLFLHKLHTMWICVHWWNRGFPAEL